MAHIQVKQNIKSKKQMSQEVTAWVLSMPALLTLTTFMLLPFLLSIYFSFTNRMLIMSPNVSTKFIGLKNYSSILEKEEFYMALMNTFKFAIVVVPIQTSLALILALLINSKLRFIYFFRTIYFSPVVITMVVVSIVWALLLAPGPEGPINTFLHFISFGTIEPKAWLFDKELALYSIIILSIWQGVGFQMIIFLAGLQFISKDFYEASSIDGAGKLKQFFYVTLPQLKNTTVFIIITTTIFAFKLFAQVYVLTQGGPQNSTLTLVYLLYSEGFIKMKIGYASAISVMFFVIVLIISIIQMKLTRINETDD